MAAAVSVTPSPVKVGDSLSFAATGFAATHSISLAVTSPDSDFILHDAGTTDGSGNYTWSGEVEIGEIGILAYSITDGTSTIAGRIQVFTR